MCLYSWDYTINHIQNKNGKKSHRYDINRRRSAHGHKYSEYKGCLNRWCLYVLSNTWPTLEAQFLRKLSNTEAELKKKCCLIKKVFNQNILKLSYRPFAFTSYSFSKKGNELFSRPHCLHDFWRKIYLL